VLGGLIAIYFRNAAKVIIIVGVPMMVVFFMILIILAIIKFYRNKKTVIYAAKSEVSAFIFDVARCRSEVIENFDFMKRKVTILSIRARTGLYTHGATGGLRLLRNGSFIRSRQHGLRLRRLVR